MSYAARRGAVVAALLLVLALLAAGPAAAAPKICPDRFTVNAGGSALTLPVCTSRPLTARDDGVGRLVIVVHGTNRNAADYYGYMEDTARAAGASDALVVAPQFLTSADGASGSMLRWTSDGWKDGSESQTSPSVSSYAAVDQLIARVADGTLFPNLREVVVAGHSAGGQFVVRYAATNRIDGAIAQPLRYVVANPSSYPYLNNERPVSGSTDQFAVPSSSCSGWDSWKYGLNGLAPYAAAVGAGGIRAQFMGRHVIYLLGEQDTDPNESSLDKSCQGELQGAYRLQRGTAYFNHLRRVYGPAVYQTQSRVTVPGVAHDGYKMFSSQQGRDALFAGAPAARPAPAPTPAPSPAPAPAPALAPARTVPRPAGPAGAASAAPAHRAKKKRRARRRTCRTVRRGHRRVRSCKRKRHRAVRTLTKRS